MRGRARLAVAAVVLQITAAGSQPTAVSPLAVQPGLPGDAQPVTVENAGRVCTNQPMDMFNTAWYFGAVSIVYSTTSDALTAAVDATGGLDGESGALEISPITVKNGTSIVHGDEFGATPETVAMGPEYVSEATRLASGQVVMVSLRPSSHGADAWVQFITLVDDSGALAFVGDCAWQLFGQRLAAYRDSARPDETTAEVFMEVISDETVWSDFNDWDLGEGPYGAPALVDLPGSSDFSGV